MALTCAWCGSGSMSHKTQTAGCLECGLDTAYDGTKAESKRDPK